MLCQNVLVSPGRRETTEEFQPFSDIFMHKDEIGLTLCFLVLFSRRQMGDIFLIFPRAICVGKIKEL